MQLLIVILALGFVQVWGADNPLHKDGWFRSWVSRIENSFSAASPASSLIAVLAPSLALLFIIYFLSALSAWLVLPIATAALLYSFGRGEFKTIVEDYGNACIDDEWPRAIERARSLGVKHDDVKEGDWSALHAHVLEEASYRGFERMFTVLFWFLLLGPAAAFLYRLLFLYVQQRAEDAFAEKWLWFIEWPVARMLGISFALTGNFVGCYHRWKECVFCLHRDSRAVVSESVLGALSVDDELVQTCEVTRKEIELLHRLYNRTLWFWLGASAFVVLFS